jgi:hypothetical protein
VKLYSNKLVSLVDSNSETNWNFKIKHDNAQKFLKFVSRCSEGYTKFSLMRFSINKIKFQARSMENQAIFSTQFEMSKEEVKFQNNTEIFFKIKQISKFIKLLEQKSDFMFSLKENYMILNSLEKNLVTLSTIFPVYDSIDD